MRLLTQNVRSAPPMPQEAVLHDVGLCDRQGGVILWQEITRDRYEAAVQGMGPEWRHFGFDRGDTPISWRHRYWTLIESGHEPLHDGHGLTPPRWVTWVKLQRVGTTQVVVFNNAHYIAKAWSTARGADRRARQALWTQGNTRHRALIAGWVAQGYPVAGGGDFNRREAEVLGRNIGGRRVRYLVRQPTLDYLYVIDGTRLEWTVSGFRTLGDRNSDHPGRQASVRLRRKRGVVPPTVARVIRTAKSQVGVHEGRTGGRWNNDTRYADEVPGLEWADGQPWCAVFVAWVARKSGVAPLYPVTASCDVAGRWFKDQGRWSEYPAIGAQVFYGTPSDLSHTGLVVSYTADTITTVEGNTNTSGAREGDGVYLKIRPRRGANVIGYGYPKFPEGITSADPAWKGKK